MRYARPNPILEELAMEGKIRMIVGEQGIYFPNRLIGR